MTGLVSSVSLALVAALASGAHPSAAPAPLSVPAPCDDAYLGVHVIPASDGGAEITRVLSGSPAASAGLRVGDRIVAIGDAKVADADRLIELIEARVAGERVELALFRGEDKQIVTLALGNRAEVDSEEMPSAPRWTPFETTPIEPIEPGEPGEPGEPRIERRSWVPVEPPRATERDDLHGRIGELRARMEDRWRELDERLADRLSGLHDRRGARQDDLQQRLDELRRDMERARAEQERRLDELIRSIESRGTDRRGAGRSAPEPSVATPSLRVAVPPVAPIPPVAPVRPVPPIPPVPLGAPPATADDVRALRDDVRALRADVAELRKLLTERR